jgi:hypothetical protein
VVECPLHKQATPDTIPEALQRGNAFSGYSIRNIRRNNNNDYFSISTYHDTWQRGVAVLSGKEYYSERERNISQIKTSYVKGMSPS